MGDSGTYIKNYLCPALCFMKCYFLSDKSTLGKVTKRYERILSIAEHIFAEKRRKLSVRTFSGLGVVKLNEKPLDKSYFYQETKYN
jgi:hypothetical protein